MGVGLLAVGLHTISTRPPFPSVSPDPGREGGVCPVSAYVTLTYVRTVKDQTGGPP
jgi:hypothetical protein